MNNQTLKILKAGAGGMRKALGSRGGAHVSRKPIVASHGANDEVAEGMAEYFEKKTEQK